MTHIINIALLTLAFSASVFSAQASSLKPHVHPVDEGQFPASEVVEIASGWSSPVVYDDVAYFLFDFPFKLERYDLASEQWFPRVFFGSSPRSLAVDDSGIYVGFADRVSHFDLNGGNETVITGLPGEASEILIYEHLLLLVIGGELQSYEKTGGSMIDSLDIYLSGGTGHSVDRLTGRLFARSTGVSPSDIASGSVDLAGMFTYGGDSPYHGDFPGATWTRVIEAGMAVIDSSGTVYTASDLTYKGSFGGAVQGLAETGLEFIVLSGGRVARLDDSYRQIGAVDAESYASAVAYKGGKVFQFGELLGEPAVSIRPLGSITAFTPPPVEVPVDGDFTATEIGFAETGRLVFLDAGHDAIHRFELDAFSYGASSALPSTPVHMGVDSSSGKIAVTYNSGRVGHVPALAGNESHFISQPYTPLGVAMVDGFTMVCDMSGAWESHWYYDSDALLTDWQEWNHCSRVWTWSQGLRRLYFFRDGTSPNDLHWEQVSSGGQVIAEGESPLHGGLGTTPPIRVHPSDAYIVLGSGDILDGSTLNLLGSLPISLADITWVNGTMFTLSESQLETGMSTLVRWTQSFTNGGEIELAGSPRALVAYAGVLYAVTQFSGKTHIIPISPNLDSLDLAVSISAPDGEFDSGQATSYLVEFVNHGGVAAVAEISVIQSIALTDSTWTCEDKDGFFPCGNGVELSDSRLLQPGGWMRLTVTGNFPDESVQVNASIFPVEDTDIEIGNNSAQATIELVQVIFKSGFEG